MAEIPRFAGISDTVCYDNPPTESRALGTGVDGPGSLSHAYSMPSGFLSIP